ncbi:hypothetical protein [Limosilactobacillus reuteri]|uniref:hypothetical protein n=1 Tax=Limosilactobacillus reuteri TaxID=1598 RepID=UPI000B980A9D|nr:hypothetical protein [Limosilactobacillus reuteri]OYS80584.1 hypothetical protein CBG11_07070 [Limosilactobacillus reuteri]
MMVNEAKLKLVDSKIEDNLDILLASFGLYGIVRSELKIKKIDEVLESLSGDLTSNISLFSKNWNFITQKIFNLNDSLFMKFKILLLRNAAIFWPNY